MHADDIIYHIIDLFYLLLLLLLYIFVLSTSQGRNKDMASRRHSPRAMNIHKGENKV